jgi:hypothetical protein
MAIFGWPYFFWASNMPTNTMSLTSQHEIDKGRQASREKKNKKYKRKRLPWQPFSITASGLR